MPSAGAPENGDPSPYLLPAIAATHGIASAPCEGGSSVALHLPYNTPEATAAVEGAVAAAVRELLRALQDAADVADSRRGFLSDAFPHLPDGGPFALDAVNTNVLSLERIVAHRPVWSPALYGEVFPVVLALSRHTDPDTLAAARTGELSVALLELSKTSVPQQAVKVAHVVVRNLMRATDTRLFAPPRMCFLLATWVSWQLDLMLSCDAAGMAPEQLRRARDDRDLAVSTLLDRMCRSDACWVDEDLAGLVRASLPLLDPPQLLAAEAFLERVARLGCTVAAPAGGSPSRNGHAQGAASGPTDSSPCSVSPPSRSGSSGATPPTREGGVVTTEELRAFLRDRLSAYVAEEAALCRALQEQRVVAATLEDEHLSAARELQELIGAAASERKHELVARLLRVTGPPLEAA